MTKAYWTQWSPVELMSMHGIELDEFRDEDHDDNKIEKKEHCCSRCMDCLGLSYRDFI